MFDRATIRLGIGPHSSLYLFFLFWSGCVCVYFLHEECVVIKPSYRLLVNYTLVKEITANMC